jgi:hypothetical protein
MQGVFCSCRMATADGRRPVGVCTAQGSARHPCPTYTHAAHARSRACRQYTKEFEGARRHALDFARLVSVLVREEGALEREAARADLEGLRAKRALMHEWIERGGRRRGAALRWSALSCQPLTVQARGVQSVPRAAAAAGPATPQAAWMCWTRR